MRFEECITRFKNNELDRSLTWRLSKHFQTKMNSQEHCAKFKFQWKRWFPNNILQGSIGDLRFQKWQVF